MLVRGLMAAPHALLIIAFFSAMISLIMTSFYSDGTFSTHIYTDILQRSSYQRVILRTVWISVLTTGLCLLLGYPLAYFLSRSRHRNVLLLLIISPWLVSLVVRTFAWMVILGNTGVVNTALMAMGLTVEPIQLIYNSFGVVIGLVHIFIPFMVIAILSVLLVMDPALEEAGGSLGATPFQTFRRVTWPLSIRGVISGTSLVYLMSSGAIVTPLLLGGLRDRMMGTQIYQEVFQVFNADRASAMAVILLATSLAVVLPLQALDAHVQKNRS